MTLREILLKQPRFLPNTLSIFRLFLSPLFYSQLIGGGFLAFPVFILAIISDLFDGKISRLLKNSSTSGAILDASADFFIIATGFSYFISVGLVSSILLIMMGICFLQYVLTLKTSVDDPFGRYVGSILYGLLTFLLLFPSTLMGIIVTVAGVSYVLAALLSRFTCILIKVIRY